MRLALSACGLVAVLATSSACAVSIDNEGTIQREERRFPAEGTVDVHLYTFDGAIEVRAWDRPEVLVEVEKRGQDAEAISKIEILTTQEGRRLQVEARHPGSGGVFIGVGRFTSPSARLIATVPASTNLVVRTGDGAIRVERVRGRIELRSDDGRIEALELSGELLAETRDGQIQIDEVTGRVEVRTGDGSVRVTGTPTVLRARSGDGAIVLRLRSGTRMSEDWMVATDDGSISVELPTDFNGLIEADPGPDGRARTDLTLSDASGGTRDNRVLRGRLGDGGRTFILRTGDGTIRLTNY